MSVCTAGVASASASASDDSHSKGSITREWKASGADVWVVPEGVTQLKVSVAGAQGGGDKGGKGGVTEATLKVTPGEKLQINVGGRGKVGTNDGTASGGFGGGGEAASWWFKRHGSGGGGASDIRLADNGNSLGNRLVVAGGGGGSAEDYAGGVGGGGGVDQNGHPLAGGNGESDGLQPRVAAGATQDHGGEGAIGIPVHNCKAKDGSLGKGGDAWSCEGVGGGGGGGNYGGGGGTHNSAGGGGSGYASAAATDVTGKSGTRGGDGEITITW